MAIRNRLLLFFLGITLFGILLVGLITYKNSVKYLSEYEHLVLEDFSEYIINLIHKLEIPLDDPEIIAQRLAGFSENHFKIFIQDDSGNFYSTYIDNDKHDIVTTHDHLKSETDHKHFGYTKINDHDHVWFSTKIPGSNAKLILMRKASIGELYKQFGTPIIAIGLVLTWISVWGALITASLFKKLEKQKSKLETQASELEDAKDRALAANEAKSKFLANISHELRTPLNAIIGYSEILIGETENTGRDNHLSDLQKIYNAGKHLLHLINDLLDLSKIEAGKMNLNLEHVDIHPLIQEICDIARPLALKNHNQCHVDIQTDNLLIYNDYMRLKQILFNLISNACKFTIDGQITLTVRQYDDQHLAISVADTGIGIEKDVIDTLFNEFVQADSSTTRKYGGTGLGLTICRNLVRMMGGHILVSSTPMKGSTFTAVFPMQVNSFEENNLLDVENP